MLVGYRGVESQEMLLRIIAKLGGDIEEADESDMPGMALEHSCASSALYRSPVCANHRK